MLVALNLIPLDGLFASKIAYSSYHFQIMSFNGKQTTFISYHSDKVEGH